MTDRCAHLLCSLFSPPPPPPEIYTLSLHDALPISLALGEAGRLDDQRLVARQDVLAGAIETSDRMLLDLNGGADRKSTRLNSSHRCISYAVFCLKKKKKNPRTTARNTNNSISQSCN